MSVRTFAVTIHLTEAEMADATRIAGYGYETVGDWVSRLVDAAIEADRKVGEYMQSIDAKYPLPGLPTDDD